MPTFDYTSSNRKSGHTSGGGAYSKLLAIFNKQKDIANSAARSLLANITLKESHEYNDSLSSVNSSGYIRTAGCDLGAIFYPYTSVVGEANMPSFNSTTQDKFLAAEDPSGVNVKLHTLLPFYWNPDEDDSVFLRSAMPSGDGLPYVVSGDSYIDDVNEVRSPDNVRSIGIRLPAIGVGWGFTQDGNPFPEGSGRSLFKGDFEHGYQVNPCDYVAAPIDLRYDKYRNVWGTPKGFWAKITAVSSGVNEKSVVPVYSWTEQLPNISGIFKDHISGRQGTTTSNPAIEANRSSSVPVNSIIWLEPKDRLDSYYFNYSSSDSTSFVAIITDKRKDGDRNRWTYGFSKATKQLAGYGGWVTAGTLYGSGYNIIENQNSIAGVYGNGVDQANLLGGMEIKPVPTGTLVRMTTVSVDTIPGLTEYWFAYENAIDGLCY